MRLQDGLALTLIWLAAACGDAGSGEPLHDGGPDPSPDGGLVEPGEPDGGSTGPDDGGSPGDGGGGEPDGGQTDPPPLVDPVVDLRADVNRDGFVDLDDPADDEGEELWTEAAGAILLANLDDDAERCPASMEDGEATSDDALAACHDAADEVVNGPDDALDLAPLRIAPWPEAPDDAVGTLTAVGRGASRVRIFKRAGTALEVLASGAELSAGELRAGLELGIEATDVVRDRAVWDGRVDLVLRLQRRHAPATAVEDLVQLRVAPVILSHHLQPARWLSVSALIDVDPDSLAFRAAVADVAAVAGLPEPVQTFETRKDRWMQDFFEAGHASMPGPDGPQRMDVLVRSAFKELPDAPYSPLRRASRIVFYLKGKDVAVVQQYQRDHAYEMKTLDAMGNLEVVPPHAHGDAWYPHGRIIRGKTATWYPDPSLTRLLESQEAQPPIYVDTSWLFVGHVDETLAFVPSELAPRGWVALVADPMLARTLLEELALAGHGEATLFSGLTDRYGNPADRAVSDILTDTTLEAVNTLAAERIAAQVAVLRAETGLLDEELVRVPVLYSERTTGRLAAYSSNTVNLVAPVPALVAAPDPHGPLIDGVDPFRAQLEAALAPHGVAVEWVDTWAYLHAFVGEIHCGTNAVRELPEAGWWTGDGWSQSVLEP